MWPPRREHDSRCSCTWRTTSASNPQPIITRNRRPFARPASKGQTRPDTIVRASLSGFPDKPKCLARRLAVPAASSEIGTPGSVRFVNSAAVPSPPAPTKARRRPSRCSSLAWPVTSAKSVFASTSKPAFRRLSVNRSTRLFTDRRPAFGLTEINTCLAVSEGDEENSGTKLLQAGGKKRSAGLCCQADPV